MALQLNSLATETRHRKVFLWFMLILYDCANIIASLYSIGVAGSLENEKDTNTF